MLYVVLKVSVFHLWTGPVILYVLYNILKTDSPQIFHGLVVHFKTIFCSLVYKLCYVIYGETIIFMGRQSYKSIAKFRETFILNQFTCKKSQPVIFLKKRASTTFWVNCGNRIPFPFKVFTLISTATVARIWQ